VVDLVVPGATDEPCVHRASIQAGKVVPTAAAGERRPTSPLSRPGASGLFPKPDAAKQVPVILDRDVVPKLERLLP
jgi:hypothetical protein